jgi:hypothetical protein
MRAPRVLDDPYAPKQRVWKCPPCGKVPADGTITEHIRDGRVVLRYRLCRECEQVHRAPYMGRPRS